MKRFCGYVRGLAAAVCLLSFAGTARAVPEQICEPGFVSLFNGCDLTGWEDVGGIYGVDAAEPGVLQCFPDRPLAKGKKGNLVTAKDYRNFILRFEFCVPVNANNGLGIRMTELAEPAAYKGMCELQIIDESGPRFFDGKKKRLRLRPYQVTGSVYGMVPAKRGNPWKFDPMTGKPYCGAGTYSYRPGCWNTEEVWVAGDCIRVWLNGTLIVDTDLSKFKGTGDTMDRRPHPGLRNVRGRIGWLGHGANVRWRNIRLRELPDTATTDDAAKAAR